MTAMTAATPGGARSPAGSGGCLVAGRGGVGVAAQAGVRGLFLDCELDDSED